MEAYGVICISMQLSLDFHSFRQIVNKKALRGLFCYLKKVLQTRLLEPKTETGLGSSMA
jgi:hypothetical protein